jgi:hypothetical protein
MVEPWQSFGASCGDQWYVLGGDDLNMFIM